MLEVLKLTPRSPDYKETARTRGMAERLCEALVAYADLLLDL